MFVLMIGMKNVFRNATSELVQPHRGLKLGFAARGVRSKCEDARSAVVLAAAVVVGLIYGIAGSSYPSRFGDANIDRIDGLFNSRLQRGEPVVLRA